MGCKAVLYLRRSDRRAVQHAWGAWRSGFQHRKSRKQKLAISVRRMSHKYSATAFEQWKEYVTVSKMLRLQQHHAMQHLQDVRLRQFWAAWQSVNFQQQQHKVGILEVSMKLGLRSGSTCDRTHSSLFHVMAGGAHKCVMINQKDAAPNYLAAVVSCQYIQTHW